MKLWRICKEATLSDGRHFVRLVRKGDGPIASGVGVSRFAALRAALLNVRSVEAHIEFMAWLRRYRFVGVTA